MPKFPVALNPFKTRVPTTRLGSIGKALNPLNPYNAAAIVLEEAISGITGATLGPEAQQRAEYFGFGLLPGIALNAIDAGSVSAMEDQLLEEARAKYLEEQMRERRQREFPPG